MVLHIYFALIVRAKFKNSVRAYVYVCTRPCTLVRVCIYFFLIERGEIPGRNGTIRESVSSVNSRFFKRVSRWSRTGGSGNASHSFNPLCPPPPSSCPGWVPCARYIPGRIEKRAGLRVALNGTRLGDLTECRCIPILLLQRSVLFRFLLLALK